MVCNRFTFIRFRITPFAATCPRRIPCLRSGYTDPRACQQCRCPDGLTGQVCDRILSTATNCGQQILRTNGRDQSLSQRGAGNCNFLIMVPSMKQKILYCPCHIQAPANARVIISFDTIQFQAANPCQQQSFVRNSFIQRAIGPNTG